MFAVDDRTGNVLTTVLLFTVAVVVVIAARATLTAFVVALLLAYLLEPAVTWVQSLLPHRSPSRGWAIALVYLLAALLVGGLGYALAPVLAGQFKRLSGAMPEILARITDQGFLSEDSSFIAGGVDRVARAIAGGAEGAGWLLTAPIIAILLLNNRPALIDGTIDFFARRRDRAPVKRTVERIDTMLAQYIRAQLTLAGLSAAFYSGAMALLGFPYALALGVLGGALEFLSVVGWIVAAALMLTSGWLAHAHWIWMAGLIVVWRLVQNFVNSPRIVGDRLAMEPLTVILALMAGGQIAGLLGVLLSVPTVAVLRILWLDRSSRQSAAVA